MKLRNVLAALTLCSCVFLSIVTLKQYGSQIKSHQDASAQDADSINQFAPARWMNASAVTTKAVKSSILAQLNAFKANDYQKAIFYQSSTLKSNFNTPGGFRQMMQSTYPEFVSYKTASFGPMLSATNRKLVEAPVKLTGTDGNTVSALYFMFLEDGVYRVAGVQGGRSLSRSHTPSVLKTI